MCGIFGVVEWEGPLSVKRVVEATDAICHRGPDENGFLFDNAARVDLPGRSVRWLGRPGDRPWQLGFGHRRLAILDLTSGQQPMLDSTGSWATIYNGEIYNHLELRHELERAGAAFLTDHSDTETLLVGFARMGPAALPRLNGMFAAAIYHRDTGRLWLVRDRFGKKPLYLHQSPGRLVFASELKAIVEFLGSAPAVNWDALGDFMMRAYIPEPRTIYEGTVKIPAACCAEIDLNVPGGKIVTQSRFWDFHPQEPAGRQRPEADWLAELEHLLDDAVKIRLLSDVPVGAFLSSGIDSATVCALATRHVSEPLRAFTIGTSDAASDESTDAAEVAGQLGLRHRVGRCQLDPHTLLDEMAHTFDEPFSDLSMAPTSRVAELAAREVKVVITGDGADEFFAGYGIFRDMANYGPYERIPGLTPVVRGVLGLMPLGARGSGLLARHFRGSGLNRYLNGVENPQMLTMLAPGIAEKINPRWQRLEELWAGSESFETLTRVSLLQGMTYLTDDILVKVDRATMAHSLEARAPFLDYRVVELTASMPPALKLPPQGRGKAILRKLASKWFPASYLEKPKRGFVIPLKQWMQRDMTREMDELSSCPLLSPREVHRFVSLQRHSKRDFSSLIWRLMVLNRWLQRWRPALN